MKKTSRPRLVLYSTVLVLVLIGVLLATVVHSWNLQTVDQTGADGSIAYDVSGYSHICYTGSDGLKYASWTGTTWTVQTVDSGGFGACLTLDFFKNPYISYYLGSDLKYANWNGTGWATQTVDHLDNNYQEGMKTSITLGLAGTPQISYNNANQTFSLKYASFNGNTWNTMTVDQSGSDSSIAVDSTGNTHISYVNGDGLKYASLTGSAWSTVTVDKASTQHFASPSIAMDSEGYPHVAYGSGGSLKYASWTGSEWSIETVDSQSQNITGVSFALDSNGNPRISYCVGDKLKCASWNFFWSLQTVDTQSGNVCSLALDSDGCAFISYNQGGLKYAEYLPLFSEYVTAVTLILGVIVVSFAVLRFRKKRAEKPKKQIVQQQ
jgi:hypothetical protein